jgi:hypothetical protein
MSEKLNERIRCIAIIESHVDGASLETRRTLTRIVNEIQMEDADASSQQPKRRPDERKAEG